jgi:AAA ATPase domain
LESLASAAAAGEGRQVLLIRGEAGIGKSRLLARLQERMHAVGGRAVGGRAFEAEMGRPYAIWIDLLRALVHERGPEGLSNLAPLLPEIARRRASPADKSQLFDAVVNVLKIVIAEQPTALTLDDLQWIDEASASLLHYVIRTFDGPSPLLLACAARSGELEDNPASATMLRALQREGRSVEIALGPVGREEAAELVHAVDPSLDSDRVFADSEGNPLFILELARARSRHQPAKTRDGDADRSPSIEAVIAGQLARLKDRSRELLTWAAALGRSFSLDPLARIAAFDTFELLPVLEELERRGIVKPVGSDTYDFVHDLVRQTAYESISHPRRKLLHRRIAQFLATVVAGDDDVANDLVRHAALCEDYEVAARACVVAGERSLRMFANTEATVIAERGLRYVARLGHGAARLEVHVGLLKICILAAAGPGMRPPPPLREELVTAVAEAEKLGLAAVAATGHYLLSVLNQQAGDSRRAQQDTLRAAQAGRATEPIRQAQQLANTARCLLELEAEVDRARTLLQEAELIAGPLGLQLCELHWGQGLLRRWDGEDEAAAKSIERALALARAVQDRWREYKCLTWLAVIELERGRCSAAIARCADLLQVALKLGESEVPFVMTLEALARLTAGEYGAADAIAAAIRKLRAVDDKSYLAYALNTAARLHLGAGRIDIARACAAEALALAETVQRRNEMVIAQATLARLGHPDDGRQMAASIRALMHEVAGQDRFSSLARSAVLETMEAADSNAGSNAMH